VGVPIGEWVRGRCADHDAGLAPDVGRHAYVTGNVVLPHPNAIAGCRSIVRAVTRGLAVLTSFAGKSLQSLAEVTAAVVNARTAHPGGHTPAALNGFGLWVAMMIALTVVNYGFPIAQLASLKDTSVPAIFVGGQ